MQEAPITVFVRRSRPVSVNLTGASGRTDPTTMSVVEGKLNGSVTVGVDTHGVIHHAAVLDQVGRQLADAEFTATPAGYRQLITWARRYGAIDRVGVEGTGSYGAGLVRHLLAEQVRVVEVDRPDRAERRRQGKSDPLDAYSAARAALNGKATGLPKSREGSVEAVRVLRVARRSAVKARTQTMNQLKALIVTAPAVLREGLRGLTPTALVRACSRLRAGVDGAAMAELGDPATAATKTALRRLARRYIELTDEIAAHDADILPLIQSTAPDLLAIPGVGPDVAGQLLATAGGHPHRLRSESSFAHLCGVAPIPASSGRTHRHRLNRGGDRAANNALYTIVLSRLRYDPRTRDYVTKRTAEGLSKKEIIRCLKRHVAREVFRALPTATTATTTAAVPQLDSA